MCFTVAPPRRLPTDRRGMEDGRFFRIIARARRGIALLCVLCTVGTVLFGCAQPGDDGTEELPTVIVGSDNYPPFNYEDADGKPTGIDVELATEAFSRMGYRPVFVTIDWEAKKELVESGEIDCIWGGFSIDGREDLYNWTVPYMYSRQVVAVREDSDIYTFSDLAGKRIAVQSTTKPEEIFLSGEDARIPKIDKLFSVQNRELIYPYLSKGYADAIAAHETAVLQCMADYDLEYRILDEPLLTVGLGVAFFKGDGRGLAERLSEVFLEMKRDGTMERIIGKYLSSPEKYTEDGIHAN